MNKSILSAACLALCGMTLSAQSAIDGYDVSQEDLRGTARFMSMAGAFGALGGDLSTLTQNPAGIGVYRSSEVGVTVDFDFQSNKTANRFSDSQTKVYCNNFGYVGAVNLNSDLLKTFNWGATFTRKASFDRNYGGQLGEMPTSLTNYIANFTSAAGYTPDELDLYGGGNPYQGLHTSQGMIYPDWLSILSYNSGLINPVGPGANYFGLYQNGTDANASFRVNQKGYIDEYSINFGGNFSNVVYWGIGFGITDMKFNQSAYYSEDLTNAAIPDKERTGIETGNGYFGLNNFKQISGSGFNLKLGVIVKPTDALRLGLAFHTPTWYNLNYNQYAFTDFGFSSKFAGHYGDGYEETDPLYGYFEYNMRSPWKMIASVAGVIGGRFILSADYQRDAYDAISYSDPYGYDYYYENQDFKTLFKSANTFRVGAEVRVTPQLSVRAGYSYSGDNVRSEPLNQQEQVFTSGTNPAYTFNKTTQYITCGLGYKFGRFYVDAAYAYRTRDAQYQPFTNWPGSGVTIPTANVNQTDNNLVLSLGYKF